MPSRSQIDVILVNRTGPWMVQATMDSNTIDGTNLDLVDPIRGALSDLGLTTSSFSNVTDDDLSTLTSPQTEALLDLSEHRLCQIIFTRFSGVDIIVGSRSARQDQLADRIQSRIKELAQKINSKHADIVIVPVDSIPAQIKAI